MLGRLRPRSLRRRRGEPAEVADTERRRALCHAALSGRRPDAEALLAELRTVVEHGSPYERRVAAAELLQAPPALWLHLDRHARPAQTGTAPHAPGAPDPLRLLLASLDRDGRVRQAAVEGLAAAGAGPLVASALALRAVDWVSPVRARAAEALVRRTEPDEAAAAVRLLLRLDGRLRAAGPAERYRRALTTPQHRRSVRALAADADPRARRFGVELALELGEYVLGDLARTALRDPDPVCRRLCAQRLLDLDPEKAWELLWWRSAEVRELAVAALPEGVPAARLVRPLADGSPRVRAQARRRLHRRDGAPAEFYRGQLTRPGAGDPPRLVAGLVAGLGECGDATDVPLLAELAGPARPAAVRRSAARAVGRLAKPTELAGLLGPLALDPDAGVARAALDALRRAEGEIPDGILRAGREREEPAVRRAADRLEDVTRRRDRRRGR